MRLRLEHALLDSGVASDVVVEVEDGWIKSVGSTAILTFRVKFAREPHGSPASR